MKIPPTILLIVILYGCHDSNSVYITSQGLTTIWNKNCDMGMLLNSDGNNILDISGNPITCSGKIKLTADQYNRVQLEAAYLISQGVGRVKAEMKALESYNPPTN